MSIAQNIVQLKTSLPQGVTLVAVSKFHPVEALWEAYNAGQRVFGESRAQELSAKQKVLPTNTSKVKIKEPAKINQHLAAQSSDSRKIRLLNKLERNPEMFFSDSNKKIVRLAGKTAFNPILKPVLGNVIIKLSKKIIH